MKRSPRVQLTRPMPHSRRVRRGAAARRGRDGRATEENRSGRERFCCHRRGCRAVAVQENENSLEPAHCPMFATGQRAGPAGPNSQLAEAAVASWRWIDLLGTANPLRQATRARGSRRPTTRCTILCGRMAACLVRLDRGSRSEAQAHPPGAQSPRCRGRRSPQERDQAVSGISGRRGRTARPAPAPVPPRSVRRTRSSISAVEKNGSAEQFGRLP